MGVCFPCHCTHESTKCWSTLVTSGAISSFWVPKSSLPFVELSSSFFVINISVGRIEELGSLLGTKNKMPIGRTLKKLRITIAIQRLSNWVLVMFKVWSNRPPAQDEVRLPTWSIDISNAKNVPSMPEGQIFELSTRRGIHLRRPIIWEIAASHTAAT